MNRPVKKTPFICLATTDSKIVAGPDTLMARDCEDAIVQFTLQSSEKLNALSPEDKEVLAISAKPF